MEQLSTAEVDGHRIEFRLIGEGPRTAVVLHGGHMSAACGLGEQILSDAGLSVLLVTRPGYGRTDLSAGPTVPEFAPRLARLIDDLRLSTTAVVGISLGARSALTLAAFYPDLVQRVILLCPVSFRPWPPARSRRIARLAFNPATERVTWGIVHRMLRSDPDRHLPRLVEDLSTLRGAEIVQRLGSDRAAMVQFLLSCRSRRGWLNDLRPPTDVTADVSQPTLVVASRYDGSVAAEHSEHLVATLPDARLVEVDTPTHILWLGQGAEQTRAAMTEFLAEDWRGGDEP
jgi:pimeloyl-ACP methyl ester carboxylesterase